MTTTSTLNTMPFATLNPTENRASNLTKDILSNLSNQDSKKGQIKQGMSPKEIAEIVSDHLIEVVRKQFDIAKDQFHYKTDY